MWMVERVCNKKETDVYVASCVEKGGIYHYKMDDGVLNLIDITSMDRPMYMVVKERKMYIILRAPFTNGDSGLIIYDIDDNGKLVNPSEIFSTKGKVACHLAVEGEDVYCVNYISGSVIKMPELLVEHEGHGIHPQRQEKPHTHYVGVTPDHKYVCVTDLGLDTIFIYDKNLKCYGKAKVPEGHGVRHLAFSEDGKWLFAVNELMSTVSVFAYENGRLKFVDNCKILPSDFQGVSTAAAIRVRDHKIYVSNRGHDTIAILKFHNNRLELDGHIDCGGQTPRDFNFTGEYMLSANQDSHEICVFNTSDKFRLSHKVAVPEPICVCVGCS